ncbi:MAG: hypothetical protein IKG71_01155 [Firmicutes bacterium]|nr:hypothetical protein [Bacillota bacterium]
MNEGHRVQDLQTWMSSFKQQVAISVQPMQTDIGVAKLDIQDWDSIKESLEHIDQEINFLYSQLSSCQASPESSPEEQSAVARRRQAIQSEIANKAAGKSNLQMKLQSRTEDLQRWLRIFGNESYYNVLGLKLQESKGKRAEMAQYQGVVQQAEAVIAGATGPNGTLSGNKYGSHIGSNITATMDQISALKTMQGDLLGVEKSIVICCRTAISLKGEIANRIGDSDPQIEYGQKQR